LLSDDLAVFKGHHLRKLDPQVNGKRNNRGGNHYWCSSSVLFIV